MAKLKVTQFVELVKRSGLVDDTRLSQALSGVDLMTVNDSGIVASSLTKVGLLTEWQSEKLLQGKHKGFFLGKYKLLNHIGAGGMGSVYLAEHTVMRRRVAIKLLPNHLANQTSYLDRFHQEARALASLDHPNVVKAFDVDHEENNHYLVMEFVEGADLQSVVSRGGPLPYATAADYTRQAALGLAYAHRMSLIHRDIKPANLLVDKTGTIKILDLGLARLIDETQGSLTMAYDQKMIGTVDYLAPEQALDSHKVDPRADIYSLGCTLYFMLTGDAPFPQGTIPQRLMQHQSAEPTPVRETRADAPEDLIAICRRMMAKAPADRFQNAEDVAHALSEWLGDGTTNGTAAPIVFPPPGPSQNEDLTLAPLEDELVIGGHRASDSKASGIGSKSGPMKSASASGARKSASSSNIMGGETPAEVPGKPKSGARPLQKMPEMAKPDDLMDELLSAPALPPTEPLRTAPLSPTRMHYEEERSPLWMVVGVGVLGAGVIVGGLLLLIWYAGL
ncbi:MAG TPA: serine/threonine-protein kinase [Pirellulales bacterium]